MEIVEAVKKAGVVGAGGAGFPTHVKLNALAHTVIANGAECEPLLQVDQYAMDFFTEELIAGLKLAITQVSADRGVIAIKRKHGRLVAKLSERVAMEPELELLLLDNLYPVGDEHVLAYFATGQVVPQGGIPLDVGSVVLNVSTLINIYRASLGQPVLDRFVTVIGEIECPSTINVPVGTPISELINSLGGQTRDEFSVIAGGPMMGQLVNDLNSPITKVTSGLILLPSDHKLVSLKRQDLRISYTKARSICCQCNYCTEMCPRYQLGHSLTPHKQMRVVGMVTDEHLESYSSAYLCTECGICGFYACVHDLLPFQVNSLLKARLRAAGIPAHPKRTIAESRPEFKLRLIPTDRLINRIGVSKYDGQVPFNELQIQPRKVIIPLHQHVGAPATPLVGVGDTVEKGQQIGEIPSESLGARIHASISGRVSEVATHSIVIEA